MENNLEDQNTKCIIINLDTKKTKKSWNNELIKKEKEIKKRVETISWNLDQEDLEHITQLNALININNKENIVEENKKYFLKIISHIKAKIQSYKQQDIIKKRLNKEYFIKYNEVIDLLVCSNLKCHYCSNNVYILYENVREQKQWSLDRINNDIGHNSGNLIISCLECNLKRRRINKDAFLFTKNFKLVREGLDDN